MQTELVVAAHFDQLANASIDAEDMHQRHETIGFGQAHQLTAGTQAIFRLLDRTIDASVVVQVFEQGPRTSRQIHDAIYAHIATIQQNKQNGIPSYCCFVDFATAYPSVHRTRLACTFKNYNIT